MREEKGNKITEQHQKKYERKQVCKVGESGTHKTQEEKGAIVRKLSQFNERGDKWVENRARKRNYKREMCN